MQQGHHHRLKVEGKAQHYKGLWQLASTLQCAVYTGEHADAFCLVQLDTETQHFVGLLTDRKIPHALNFRHSAARRLIVT